MSWDILGKFANVIAVLTLIAAAGNFVNNLWRQRKANEVICIVLVDENSKEYVLDVDILRQNCTRAEVQGMLSLVMKNSQKRYNIEYLSTKEYLKSLQDIQKNQKDILYIKVNSKDLEEFELTTALKEGQN